MARPALRILDDANDPHAWIDAARAGDEQARAALAELTATISWRYALRMMRDEQDARDISQEVLTKILRNLDRYDARFRYPTWVLSVTRNTCIDEFRRRRRRSSDEVPDVADPGPGPHELLARDQAARIVREALERLPPLYREVLVLYHYENLKYREIAELLDLPIGTVMNRIFRARQKLKDSCEPALGHLSAEPRP
jgi:RNA polymerase sigma-70 factor, ECF subfamily